MPTTFPDQAGDLIPAFERGLAGESSLYLFLTGPDETRGFGAHIPLFHVETTPDEPFEGDKLAEHLASLVDFDPQGPYFLNKLQLEVRIRQLEVARQSAERQHTDEIEAIIG